MNFKNANLVRELIWYDGPLLSEYEMRGKIYLVKWVDCEADHIWLIFEVAEEILDLYLNKVLTMRDLEERSPAVFMQEGFLGEASLVMDFDDLPDEWKARSNSYYDESLRYNAD